MPAGPMPAAVFPLRDNIKNMEIENMRFCGHLKDGTQLLLTDDEIINNALEQEKQGIKPHYCFYDYKEEKATTPPGWLVKNVQIVEEWQTTEKERAQLAHNILCAMFSNVKKLPEDDCTNYILYSFTDWKTNKKSYVFNSFEYYN